MLKRGIDKKEVFKEKRVISYEEASNKDRRRKRRKRIFFFAFITAILLSVATYAWLSTSLNVKIRFFKMTVASNSGLFISLDGINFSDSVVISGDSIIVDLKQNYPNHTNQWAAGGLWPVSTNGTKGPNNEKFEVYAGYLMRTRTLNPNGSIKRLLSTIHFIEEEPISTNSYIAFDVFLKNASGSPKPDNLYFDQGTGITFEEGIEDEAIEEMQGLLNSSRIGIVRIGSVSSKSSVQAIQNMQCNNSCRMFIYEPYHLNHSEESIKTAENYGITLVDGEYTPTYAIIAEGERIEHTNGHDGTGIPLDQTHFELQETWKANEFSNSMFEIPNGILKMRVYVWIEGQDIDSLETYSRGAAIEIAINFVKDLAGYEE